MRWTLLPARSMPWRRRMAEYAIVLPLLYLIYCTALYFAQTRLMFPRDAIEPGILEETIAHTPDHAESLIPNP